MDSEARRLLEEAATMLEECEDSSDSPVNANRYGKLAGRIQAYLDRMAASEAKTVTVGSCYGNERDWGATQRPKG